MLYTKSQFKVKSHKKDLDDFLIIISNCSVTVFVMKKSSYRRVACFFNNSTDQTDCQITHWKY